MKFWNACSAFLDDDFEFCAAFVARRCVRDVRAREHRCGLSQFLRAREKHARGDLQRDLSALVSLNANAVMGRAAEVDRRGARGPIVDDNAVFFGQRHVEVEVTQVAGKPDHAAWCEPSDR